MIHQILHHLQSLLDFFLDKDVHHDLSNQPCDTVIDCQLPFINLFKRDFRGKNHVESQDHLNEEDTKDILEIALCDLVISHSDAFHAIFVHLFHEHLTT